MARSVKLNNADEWTVLSRGGGARRRAAAGLRAGATVEVIPASFLAPEVSVEQVIEATPTATRRAAGVPMIDISVVPDSTETYALAIRHPSGALTFHAPEVDIGPRRGRSGRVRVVERVEVGGVAVAGRRRQVGGRPGPQNVGTLPHDRLVGTDGG